MRIAIVGAGLMGHALALVHAIGGHSVKLTDNNPATLAAAGGLMETALATLRDGGEVGPDWTAERLAAAVTRVDTLAETVADAELIVEAVYENTEVKRAIFAEIDALAPLGAIIASNTSRLDIFPLVPERRPRAP
jgi:3-hydroxybutyryl-CoA dehydrogenase